MKLKELKQSLSKLGSDFDDTEVILQYSTDGKLGIDILVFTGHTKDFKAVVLGSNDAAIQLKKQGGLSF